MAPKKAEKWGLTRPQRSAEDLKNSDFMPKDLINFWEISPFKFKNKLKFYKNILLRLRWFWGICWLI